eukprot:6198837-Pleurochrysis_carterae.AAC.2
MGFAKKSNRSAPTGPPMQRPSPTPSATRSNVAAPSYRPGVCRIGSVHGTIYELLSSAET